MTEEVGIEHTTSHFLNIFMKHTKPKIESDFNFLL